jgi:hypothetical protein
MENNAMMAYAIALLFVAMTLFFFTFHPGGVQLPDGTTVSDPQGILKFLIYEFQKGAGLNPTFDGTDATLTSAEQSANTAALNYPGYTSTPDTGTGNSTSSNTTLA